MSVDDLSGTDVYDVDLDLGASDDRLAVSGKVVVAGTATLTGLPARVNVSHAEGALDTLAIDTRDGHDTVDTSGLAPGTIALDVKE